MRQLSLDYMRENQIQRLVGMLVAAVAVAGIVALGFYYRNLMVQSARLEDSMAQLKLHLGHVGMMTSVVDAQQSVVEIKDANEVIMQMTLPWNELFNALEEANSNNIALLGIEPDARRRVVRVSGEAKNSEALFAYLRALQAIKSMSGVYLKSQQVQERSPERPIRFTLDASWT